VPVCRLKTILSVLALSLIVTPIFAQNTKENADFKLALNLYNDGLFDLAAEQLRQFIAAYPTTSQGVDGRFYLGLAQMKLKQYEDARTTFQSFALAYQDHPRAPEAWWNAGECFAAVRNTREAALAFERVKVFHPKSTLAAKALVQSGKYFVLAGQPEDARRVLRIVLQEYGSSDAVLTARTRLGELYFAEGNLEQARNELQRVVDGDPSPEAKAQALLILGNIARTTGNSDQATKLFQEIIEDHPQSSASRAARVSLAKLLSARGRDREALDNLKKALEAKGPVDSALQRDALVDAGDASAALGEYSAAARYYNAFIAAYPADSLLPAVLWKSAKVNSTAKNYKRSNELCTQILSSRESPLLRKRAQIQLALNALAQGNPPMALQQYQTFTELYPDDRVTPLVLMRSARLAGEEIHDLRRAAAMYELIISRYPRTELADNALAGAAASYEQLHDPDRALQLYQELIRRFPSSEQRPEADRRIRMIGTFETKDKDAGLEKLALMLGDVVAERDKEGLPYRLGEVYFYDLKNFAAAASQFTAAISAGLSDERFVDALFLRARAYENLTLQDERYRLRAIESYESFLATYGTDPRAPEASVALFSLLATTPEAALTTFEKAVSTPAGETKRDTLLLLFGLNQLESDSIAPARRSFSGLLREFPGSASAEEARYGEFLCMKRGAPPDSAAAAGRRYIDDFPAGRHAAEVLSALGTRAMERGSYAEAREAFGTLAETFPYTPQGQEARARLAAATAASGDNESAVILYRELLAERSSDPLSEERMDGPLTLGLARALTASGRDAEARSVLLAFISEKPEAADAGMALNLLGLIAQKAGSLELATSYFRQAGAAAPDAPASREIADVLYASGSPGDALKHYRRLAQTAQSPEERRYYDSRIILCRLKTGDVGGIDKDIEAFINVHPDPEEECAAFELEKGNTFYRKEEYAQARKSFERVANTFEETSSAPAALYWIGKVLEASARPQEALKQYETLLKKYPGAPISPRAHLTLGNLYYNAEKWDIAVQHYRKVVDDEKADPELLPFAMSNLISTYEIAGVYDAALALTRRYLELYPNSEDSFDKKIKIGILYQRLGYNEQSILQLQSLLDQAGSDLEGEIRYAIGEANYGKGDYQQAILEFLKVPYLVTKKGKVNWTANALYMSGQSYEKLGKYDQALVMYQQILDRTGIDETFKAAARKEIERVRTVLKKSSP
jgi:TolA-binding protein